MQFTHHISKLVNLPSSLVVAISAAEGPEPTLVEAFSEKLYLVNSFKLSTTYTSDSLPRLSIKLWVLFEYASVYPVMIPFGVDGPIHCSMILVELITMALKFWGVSNGTVDRKTRNVHEI